MCDLFRELQCLDRISYRSCDCQFSIYNLICFSFFARSSKLLNHHIKYNVSTTFNWISADHFSFSFFLSVFQFCRRLMCVRRREWPVISYSVFLLAQWKCHRGLKKTNLHYSLTVDVLDFLHLRYSVCWHVNTHYRVIGIYVVQCVLVKVFNLDHRRRSSKGGKREEISRKLLLSKNNMFSKFTSILQHAVEAVRAFKTIWPHLNDCLTREMRKWDSVSVDVLKAC